MRPLVVVVVIPGKESEISFCGVAPMSGVGPLAQSGLDKAFGFAVGLGRVGPGAAVLQAQLLTDAAKLVRAIAAAVIGQQSAHADIVGFIPGNLLLSDPVVKKNPGVFYQRNSGQLA